MLDIWDTTFKRGTSLNVSKLQALEDALKAEKIEIYDLKRQNTVLTASQSIYNRVNRVKKKSSKLRNVDMSVYRNEIMPGAIRFVYKCMI